MLFLFQGFILYVFHEKHFYIPVPVPEPTDDNFLYYGVIRWCLNNKETEKTSKREGTSLGLFCCKNPHPITKPNEST